MRAVTYFVAVSLDGRIASPDGDWSAFPETGDHLDALVAEYADALPAHVHAALGAEPVGSMFDTVLMGWNTYSPALTAGIPSPYPHLRQIVATRQPREIAGGVDTTADPVRTLRDLRAIDGGGIWLAGGGELAGSVIDEIDRLVLKINPLVLGAGIPLFGGAYRPSSFTRSTVRMFDSGVMIAEYDRTAA